MTVKREIPVQLYGQEQVAQMLNVHRVTVYRLLRQGELDSVQIGRRRMVTAASLDAYLARGGSTSG